MKFNSDSEIVGNIQSVLFQTGILSSLFFLEKTGSILLISCLCLFLSRVATSTIETCSYRP